MSVDDLWRRAGVPSASLVQIAEADALQPALKLARREALWAITGLHGAICALSSPVGLALNHRNPYEAVIVSSIVRPVWRRRATSLSGDHGGASVWGRSGTRAWWHRRPSTYVRFGEPA